MSNPDPTVHPGTSRSSAATITTTVVPRPALRPVDGDDTRPSPTCGGAGGSRRVAGRRSERGQATAEYALVMLAAAALAGLLLAWAAGTDGIGRLFDSVLESLLGRVV